MEASKADLDRSKSIACFLSVSDLLSRWVLRHRQRGGERGRSRGRTAADSEGTVVIDKTEEIFYAIFGIAN